MKKSMNKSIKVSILILFCFILSVEYVSAVGSFGITPPYVNNENLERGSVHEQRIFIVRRDPNKELQATITWDAPGANNWISIDRGSSFLLPEGEQKVPIIVRVNVPEDASSGSYQGSLQIAVTDPDLGQEQSGRISVGLQARANINLQVVGTDQENEESNFLSGLLAQVPFSGDALMLSVASLFLLPAAAILFYRGRTKKRRLLRRS